MNDILEGAELDLESAPAPVGILGVDPAGGPDRSVKVEPGALGALPDAVKRAAERARRRAPLEPLALEAAVRELWELCEMGASYWGISWDELNEGSNAWQGPGWRTALEGAIRVFIREAEGLAGARDGQYLELFRAEPWGPLGVDRAEYADHVRRLGGALSPAEIEGLGADLAASGELVITVKRKGDPDGE